MPTPQTADTKTDSLPRLHYVGPCWTCGETVHMTAPNTRSGRDLLVRIREWCKAELFRRELCGLTDRDGNED